MSKKIFISYSHKDEAHRSELEVHLAMLKRKNIVSVWHDRKIVAGDEWKNEIDARDDDDVKHICPLQLDVIERAMDLWTAPNDLVFSPFTGVGSEGYTAVRMGRKFIGSELKKSYFEQAVKNLGELKKQTQDLFGEAA